jgi:hypothetical protein
MQIDFSPRDPKNYHRLKNLPADEAIRSYLEGRFTIGEETALVEAVQRGMSLSIEKDVIEDILAECMLDEVSVQECKSRLIEGLVKYGD